MLDDAGEPRYAGVMKPPGFPVRLPVVFLATLLAACAVGPNFHQPAAPDVALTAAPLPAATANGKPQYFITAADIAGDWWNLYHNPELNALIGSALAHNPTLQASQQTLVQAEETVRAEQGAFFPSVSGNFQVQREQLSSAELASSGAGATTGSGAAVGGVGSTSTVTSGDVTIPPFTLYDASLSVSYMPDVFGLTRRQVENLAAQALYQRYELEAAYLTLTANIVTSAVTEASLQAQIDKTNQVIGAEAHELAILNTQFGLGGVPKADVLNQQAALAQAQATLPPLQLQLAEARDQLAAYAGAFPADFHAADFTLGGLHLPEQLPVSLPSAIVAQRPDIEAAAAQLHAASASLGIADANMLPQISLSATVGHEALTTGTLFTPQTLVWSLIAQLTQPLFEGGTLTARRKAALAALRGSSAQYQGTVIAAFQNVADVLQALQYDAVTLTAAEAAEMAAAQSLTVTQAEFRLGGQPFTAVLTAQITYLNAAIAEVKASAARLTDTAALFQALGGGWWHRRDVATDCCGIIP